MVYHAYIPAAKRDTHNVGAGLDQQRYNVEVAVDGRVVQRHAVVHAQRSDLLGERETVPR